jgi:deoxyribonuclease-4
MKTPLKREKIRLGVHTSIAGGVSLSIERAAALKCTTLQIFSHNPRQWKVSPIPREEAERFAALRKEHDIGPAFVHASYLINLASASKTVLEQSIELLRHELENADTLGAEYVVLHTGSASGADPDKARAAAAKSILKAIGRRSFSASLILENTAGQKGDITSSIKALAEIFERCGSGQIAGICVDTCHAFASGYDISSKTGIDQLLSEINMHVGLDKLKLIHLNDSKKAVGSRVDRHEHIGDGFIGMNGFRKLLSDKRISRVPLILETPKKTDDDDKRNLKKVLGILSKR